VPIKPVLPEPSFIYHKDFHFLDEPLIERQQTREAAPVKTTAKQTATGSNNEIDSASTAATNATDHSEATSQPAGKGAAKLSNKQMKATGQETLEESKQSSAMPIFTN